MAIPKQADCDPDNPEERFLWALMSVPVFGRNNPIQFTEPIARQVSKHLTECGYPPSDPALQTKKFQRPYRGIQHPLNNMATWVPMDTPEPDPVVIQDPVSMTNHEREAVVERLRYQGYKINEPDPEQPRAQVVDTLDEPPRFDPSDRSVTEVNVYLRELGDADPIEKGRVLYVERNGKARNGILKRHKEEG